MIKKTVNILMLIIVFTTSNAQTRSIDSMRKELATAQNDTIKLISLISLADVYVETRPDSSIYFSQQQLELAGKLKFRLIEVNALGHIGYDFMNSANYPKALETLLLGVSIAEDPESEKNVLPDKYPLVEEFHKQPMTNHMQRLDQLADQYMKLGILYSNLSNVDKQRFHLLQGKKFAQQTGNLSLLSTINLELGRMYISQNKYDSALLVEKEAYDQSLKCGFKKYRGSILLNIGRAHLGLGNRPQAIEDLKSAITACNEQNYFRGIVAIYLLFSELYRQDGKSDSCLDYAMSALKMSKTLKAPDLSMRSYAALVSFFTAMHASDSIVKYQGLILKLKDSVFNSKQVQQFQLVDFDEQQRKQEVAAAKKAYWNRMQLYGLLTGLGIFLLVAIVLWRNNLQKQRAYSLLQKQKEETDRQRTIVERTLDELKSTQAQLIQSEKMASLGELTAGIAHEIQNPLNFVNNFSEVNKELIDEIKESIKSGDKVEALNLANNIEQNLDKVVNHGKRADAIVKSMLQHSSTSTGKKEFANINELANEYLRLSYHGIRAKDNSFNVTLHTNFDQSIGTTNIIQQDIGRALLNLYNNAFYAVTEKKKQQPLGYEATVSVNTKRVNEHIEINVIDNGNGMPAKIVDKIFQPFFTTKPTGQGTGLGLSLSYDIIKAHGGELKVKTKEGDGAEFIISLPS